MDLSTERWSPNFLPEKMASVSRVTRQINEAECSNVINEGLCSPSFVQNFINAISQCGSQGSAAAIASEKDCRQSSTGEYCSSVNIDRITSDCRSNGGCSAACRKSLTDPGCCLNPYVDTLEQSFRACGLASPSACPRSSLTIPTLSDILHPVKIFPGLLKSTFVVMFVLSLMI